MKISSRNMTQYRAALNTHMHIPFNILRIDGVRVGMEIRDDILLG